MNKVFLVSGVACFLFTILAVLFGLPGWLVILGAAGNAILHLYYVPDQKENPAKVPESSETSQETADLEKILRIRNEYEKKIQDMHDSYEQKIHDMEQDYAKNLRDGQESYEKDLREMQESHTDDLRKMQEDYEQKLHGMQEDYEQKLNGMQEGYEQKLNGMQESYEQKLHGMQEDYEQKLQEMREVSEQGTQEVQEAPGQGLQDSQEAPAQDPQEPKEAPAQDPQEPQEAPAQDPQEPQEAPAQDPQEPQEAPAQDPQEMREIQKHGQLDVVKAAEEVTAEYEQAAQNAGITILVAKSTGAVSLPISEKKVRILFGNIIDNAIKYMKRKGMLQITITNLDNDVFIAVKDNGIGLPAMETEHIFEMHYQGSNNHAIGAGMGLAQVKEIVEQYGGTIYAKSSLGKGMGIYIRLPIQKGESTDE